jgi:hypothetical protein
MATTSPWRHESRRVIEKVLAALPLTASLKERRSAVEAAYPFGQRELHPYRMWRCEVREALREGNEKPPIVPKWYAVADDRERAFLDSIRAQDLDRNSLLFDAVTLLVFADFLDERGDSRGPAWRLLGEGAVWPLERSPKTWRWQPWRGHTLRASWELDAAVFDCLRSGTALNRDRSDASNVERFADYRNVFAACLDFTAAFVEQPKKRSTQP